MGSLINKRSAQGRTDGVAVVAGYVGEMALGAAVLRSGSGGFAYSVRSTTLPTTGALDLVQFSANKGVYLICVNGDVYQTSGSTRDFTGSLKVGGSAVSLATVHSIATGLRQRINFVCPVVISADSTGVSFVGTLSGVTADAAAWEMFAVRIA